MSNNNNLIRVIHRSRYQKFVELRTQHRKQQNINAIMDDSIKLKNIEKEKLLGDEIELGIKGQRPLWMSSIEEIKLDFAEIESKSKNFGPLFFQMLKFTNF